MKAGAGAPWKPSLLYAALVVVVIRDVSCYLKPIVRRSSPTALSTRRIHNNTAKDLRLSARNEADISLGTEVEDDVIVIGSGLGGLSCAALLASSGHKVTVFESHYEIGGCAHEFLYKLDGTPVPSDRLSPEDANNVYRFEAGPSLYSGLSPDRSPNPLRHVFQMIGEEPSWVTYDVWKGYFPEAKDGFRQSIGAAAFEKTLELYGGPNAISDWRKLAAALRPLTDGVMSLPTVAIRPDIGSLLTLVARYPIALLKTIKQGKNLTRPFSEYYAELGITDQFLKNYLNLLCFLLQGLPAEGTISAVMAYMIDDFFKPNAVMDFPIGGSGAIASALERGITKHGGTVLRRSHVEEIVVENGKAVGVRLRNGTVKRASKGVVSNCDMWSTYNLVPRGASDALDQERDKLIASTEMCKSFMHLHLGIDAEGLPADMPPQWTVCVDWSQPIDAPGNVIVVSMPSLLDPTLAPPGKHVIHAYTAGNEPYELWAKFDLKNRKKLAASGAQRQDKSVSEEEREDPAMTGSEFQSLRAEYEQLKEERSACLWAAIEREIPDVRQRTNVKLVGSPLTHARFNRRYEGTYGPAISAGKGTFPGQVTPLPGLYRCGDSTNPGIGVPAVAASGALAANAIMPVGEHLKLLNLIRM